VIGEFGDALLKGGNYEEEELVQEVRESDVVDLFTTILQSGYSGQQVTQYIVTSAMKLSTRLSEPAQIEKLRRLLVNYQTNLDVEIQQRSVEYSNLFNYDQVRRGVLEKMPAPEIREEQRVLGDAPAKKKKAPSKKKPSQVTEQDMLLDLMGDSSESAVNLSATMNGSQNNADLLADILGGDSISSPPPQTTSPAPNQHANIMDLFNTSAPASTSSPAPSQDLFGGLNGLSSPPPQQSYSSPPPVPQQQVPGQEAYNKNGLHITLQTRRDANIVQIMARFRNTGGATTLTGVVLQVSVPKSQKLQLQNVTWNELAPGGTATQQMKVTSVSGVSLLSFVAFVFPTVEGDANKAIATARSIASEVTDHLHDWGWGGRAGTGHVDGRSVEGTDEYEKHDSDISRTQSDEYFAISDYIFKQQSIKRA
jgi:AP-1 complex subunit gamma-1